MDDHWLALRTFDLILVLLLFAVGFKGDMAIGKPWTVGLAMLSIATLPVEPDQALGG